MPASIWLPLIKKSIKELANQRSAELNQGKAVWIWLHTNQITSNANIIFFFKCFWAAFVVVL
jgi:hypothetical protein